jgi:hypothetical protein
MGEQSRAVECGACFDERTAYREEIYRLRVENQRLREALAQIKDGKDNPCHIADDALGG